MVAEFKSGIDPLLQQIDSSRIDGAVGSQLLFVDETDGRNLISDERGNQVASHTLRFTDFVSEDRDGWKVVNGENNASRWSRRLLRRDESTRGDQQERNSNEHRSSPRVEGNFTIRNLTLCGQPDYGIFHSRT